MVPAGIRRESGTVLDFHAMSKDENWKHQNKNEAADAVKAQVRFNLTDALGDYSRKLKRNVFAWAALLFVSKYYHLSISKIPWIDVQVPSGQADVLAIVVAVPLVYSIFTFGVQAHADILAWRTRFEEQIAGFAGNAVHRAEAQLRLIAMSLTGEAPARPVPDETWKEAWENARDSINETSKHLTAIWAMARAATRNRIFFAYCWELIVPIVAALATLVYARSELVNAVLAIAASQHK